jgi:ketosteroid isomerase-like protein
MNAMDDKYAIRVAKTELREGYNTGNVDRALSAFADAYCDMSAGHASFYGTEAKAVLRHRLTTLFARYRVHLTVTIFSIRVEGSMAFDRGSHKLTLIPINGSRPKTMSTRYLEIWQKQPDGQWKIVVFIDNLDLPPAMPPREVLSALTARRPSPNPHESARRRRRLGRSTAA